MHWVTLFDDLEDDMYDGQLGEDDWEQPRILLEYSVIGSNYTSTMSNMDQLKHMIDNRDHNNKQPIDEEAGGALPEEPVQVLAKKPKKVQQQQQQQ